MNAGTPLSFRAELRRQLTRRRTFWYAVLLAALPLVLVGAFALGDPATGGTRLVDLARVGAANFAVFTLSSSADFLLLILAAQLAGDSVPSEASWSSLRYLLTAPVGRARLLTAKLAVAVVTFGVVLTGFVLWALLVGVVAYGPTSFTTTAGVALAWGEFAPRLALAVGFVFVTQLTTMGFAALFSVLTDAPLAAVGGAVIVTIVSQILLAVEQLGSLRHALPMAYARSWYSTLSPEIGWLELQRGTLWSLLTASITIALAYLVFARRDILS